jgi:ribonuclease P protein component
VGLIVPRTVGGAVTRNRVKRRLRAALRAGIGRLDAGSLVVVRARPAASTVSYRALAADLDAALSVASSSRPGAAAELACAAADAVPGVSR